MPRLELLTPRGPGGVAVVALSGPDRHRDASELLAWPSGGPIDLPACRTPRLAELMVLGEAVDQVLVVDRPERGRLEIHLHGSEAVLEALARVAELSAGHPDPATRLMHWAMSEAQLALALEQQQHDWDGFVAGLTALAPSAALRAVTAARRRSALSLALAEPARLVLCGAQNAGKSTLMNRLLFRERSLAGELPGLTRDPVRELTTLAGYPYLLVDTAGEGARAGDRIAQLAVERGRRERAGSLRLLCVDGARGVDESDLALVDERTVVVVNKADLPQAPWPRGLGPPVRVSCVDPGGASAVRTAIGASLRALRALPPAGPAGGPAALTSAQLAALDRVGGGAAD